MLFTLLGNRHCKVERRSQVLNKINFANFVLLYIKWGITFSQVYTKFANCTGIYFPHFTIFCNETNLQI